MTKPTPAMALASVIAKDDRAWVIDSHNDFVEHKTIRNAVVDDDSFFVKVAGDVLAFDCDDDDDLNAKKLVSFIRDLGGNPVVAASGREGHCHVLVRGLDHDATAAVKAEGKTFGFHAKPGIRPPFTKHRSGAFRSSLIDPLDPVDAAVLLLAPDASCGLTAMYQIILRYGNINGHYNKQSESGTDRSELTYAIVVNALRNGVPFEKLLVMLLNPKNVGGELIREKEERDDARSYLEGRWVAAQKELLALPIDVYGAPALKTIAGASDTAAPVLATLNATANVVFQKHVEIATRIKRVRYHASVREVAKLAGVGTNAVVKANKSLVEAGLIGKLESTTPTSLWFIECKTTTITREHPPKEKENVVVLHSGHDAFRHGALGKNGFRIVQAITQGYRMKKELEDVLGMVRSTVKRNLDRLIDVELVSEVDGKLVFNEEVSLDDIAEQFGTAGNGARQRAHFERERAAFPISYLSPDWVPNTETNLLAS